MTLLFDTTALSELTKPRPDEKFLAWLSAHDAQQAYLAAPSVAELEFGIALLEQSPKRTRLESWLEDLLAEFEARILPFDTACARIWGRAMANARRSGLTIPALDAQIAAIALGSGLPVVTRNTRHFAAFDGLTIIDPWNMPSGA